MSQQSASNEKEGQEDGRCPSSGAALPGSALSPSTGSEPSAAAANAKRFSNGDFLIFKASAKGSKGRKRMYAFVGGARIPQFRHPTREAAEAEAARLLTLFPESTFIVLQEIGRVRLPASAIEAAPADATAQTGAAEGESAVPKGDAQ